MAGETRMERLESLLAAARGDATPDLVIRGARVINVFDGSIEDADVAVHLGVVVGLGSYASAKEVLHAKGRFLAPGFMDGHIHIESTLLTPPRFAEAVLPRGTVAAASDPHEIANVLGIEGIRYMIESSEGLPLDLFIMLPSCVPATHLETSGAQLSARDLAKLKGHPRVLGLAEVMNFPGVVHAVPEVLEKIVEFSESVIDGHSPLLSGLELNAYLLAGPGSDHECTSLEEATEKLKKGMVVMIREGSQARNLADLAPLVSPKTADRILLVSDDRHPEDLLNQGHMDHILARAAGEGIDPALAVRMVTLNPARYFRLQRRGAVAPGFAADLCLIDDLNSFKVSTVLKRGRVVARDGALIGDIAGKAPAGLPGSMNLGPITRETFAIAARNGRARVIGLVPGQVLTETVLTEPAVKNGLVVSDTRRDILKLAVIERHRGTGNVGLGLVSGFGLKSGALASSVAHDSHNIIAVGADDEALAVAADRVRALGGGVVAAGESGVIAELALPIAGLMSPEPLAAVARGNEEVLAAAKELGARVQSPFMALSFLALPVIPELKLTDRGLVDVTSFSRVDLFE